MSEFAERKPRRRWSAEQVISEIKNLEDRSAKSIQRKKPSLYGAAVRHFGSWKAAVEKAGYDYPSVVKRKGPGHWSREKILEEIKALEQRNSGFARKTRAALYNAALRLFGSWKEAVEAAGFDYQKEIRGWVASADQNRFGSWKPSKPE